LAGDKGVGSVAAGYTNYPGSALEAEKVVKALVAGLLDITVLRPEGVSSGSGVAFDQSAETVSWERAGAPLIRPGQDKGVFTREMTDFMVKNPQGQLFEFLGGVLNRRMVIVASSAESKQLVQAQMNLVLAGAIMALGKSVPVKLAELDGVVLDLR
jgi:hypothetical protein